MLKQMIAAGYCVSPNNIHALQGCLMYPSGGGIWTVPHYQEIQVLDDRIRVFVPKFFGEQYSRKSFWDTETVAVFADVTSFLAWCRIDGRLSEPGATLDQGGMD